MYGMIELDVTCQRPGLTESSTRGLRLVIVPGESSRSAFESSWKLVKLVD
jgi:hypothetical protein